MREIRKQSDKNAWRTLFLKYHLFLSQAPAETRRYAVKAKTACPRRFRRAISFAISQIMYHASSWFFFVFADAFSVWKLPARLPNVLASSYRFFDSEEHRRRWRRNMVKSQWQAGEATKTQPSIFEGKMLLTMSTSKGAQDDINPAAFIWYLPSRFHMQARRDISEARPYFGFYCGRLPGEMAKKQGCFSIIWLAPRKIMRSLCQCPQSRRFVYRRELISLSYFRAKEHCRASINISNKMLRD